MFKFAVTFLLLSLLILPASITKAQDSASTDSAQTVTPLTQLIDDYFFQLEKYREAQNQFTLDRAEHEKLGTLATGEKLVATTRTLAVSRAKVFTTYLIAVKNHLQVTQGIDVTDKNAVLSSLDQTMVTISFHEQALSGLVERNPLQAELTRFEQQDLPRFFSVTYQALSLLSIGKIQSVADKLLVTSRNFESQIVPNIVMASKKASVERGLKEVAIKHQEVALSIANARSLYATFAGAEGDELQQVYSDVVNALEPGYGSLQQAVEYLIELEKTGR